MYLNTKFPTFGGLHVRVCYLQCNTVSIGDKKFLHEDLYLSNLLKSNYYDCNLKNKLTLTKRISNIIQIIIFNKHKP